MTCNAKQGQIVDMHHHPLYFRMPGKSKKPTWKAKLPCKATRDFLEAKSAALHDKEETRYRYTDWQDEMPAGSLLRLMNNNFSIQSLLVNFRPLFVVS